MIPAEVKAFPTWGETNKPGYSVTIADGLKPGAVTLRYASTLQPSELSDQAVKISFTRRQYKTGGIMCEKKINASRVIKLILDKNNGNNSSVETIFSGY